MVGGRIILDMPNPALDADGDPYSHAKIYYYLDGTTTPADIYTDATLTVPLANPLISDGAGRFVEVWGDVTVTISARWTDTNDAMIFTFEGIVPLAGGSVAADGSGVNAAAFRAALGLGSAALEDMGTTGATVPFLDQNNSWSGTQNFTGSVQRDGYEMGYLGVPQNTQDAAYALVLDDRGKTILHTSGSAHTWTIPPSVFSGGDAIHLRNIGAGAITLARGVGVTLRIAGVATNANATLASYGQATLTCDAANVFCIIGAGVS